MSMPLRNIKTISRLICTVAFLGAMVGMIAVPVAVFSADSGGYQLLSDLPGIQTVGTGQNFAEQTQKVIIFIIGFSTVLAVLMMVIGGFQYMMGESIGMKKDGKDRATSAVGGLVLLLISWVILNTINPELLNLNLNLGSRAKSTKTATDVGVEAPNQGPDQPAVITFGLNSNIIQVRFPENQDCSETYSYNERDYKRVPGAVVSQAPNRRTCQYYDSSTNSYKPTVNQISENVIEVTFSGTTSCGTVFNTGGGATYFEPKVISSIDNSVTCRYRREPQPFIVGDMNSRGDIILLSGNTILRVPSTESSACGPSVRYRVNGQNAIYASPSFVTYNGLSFCQYANPTPPSPPTSPVTMERIDANTIRVTYRYKGVSGCPSTYESDTTYYFVPGTVVATADSTTCRYSKTQMIQTR